MTKAYVAKQMLMGIGRMHTQSSKDFGPEQLGLTQNQGTIQWTLPWTNFGNRQERKKLFLQWKFSTSTITSFNQALGNLK